MKSPTGPNTSNKWMRRTGWVLSGLSGAFMILDGLMKLLPPTPPSSQSFIDWGS